MKRLQFSKYATGEAHTPKSWYTVVVVIAQNNIILCFTCVSRTRNLRAKKGGSALTVNCTKCRHVRPMVASAVRARGRRARRVTLAPQRCNTHDRRSCTTMRNVATASVADRCNRQGSNRRVPRMTNRWRHCQGKNNTATTSSVDTTGWSLAGTDAYEERTARSATVDRSQTTNGNQWIRNVYKPFRPAAVRRAANSGNVFECRRRFFYHLSGVDT